MRALKAFFPVLMMSGRLVAVCQQPQPRLVCAEFFRSQVVVEAKLLRVKHVARTSVTDGHVYAMQTARVLRGDIPKEFQIYEENSSGRATFDWKPGVSYLLFLDYSETDGGWELDGCGNSGPLSKAGPSKKQIHAISGAKGGMIQLVVGVNRSNHSDRKAQFSVSNPKVSVQATTDDRGIAEIHVPAGDYKVSVLGKEQLRLFDLSYESPDRVVVENGGCAQIQYF